MQFHKGDWVKWVGGSYHDLVGIVIETRERASEVPSVHRERHEVKVVWDVKGLGSLKQKAGGAWQRAACLKILSRLEQNNESR